MPQVLGQGNTYNLPNYVGELFAATPTDTPFTSSIGGLTGGKRATATIHTWSGYDLRDADKNRQRAEGADAPQAEHRSRYNARNVLEIHQEAVDVSYTRQAATGQFATTGSNQPNAVGIVGTNPVLNERQFQIDASLQQISLDLERGFINGTYQEPSDNSTVRKTRGMMEAVATNVADQGTIVGNGASTIAANGTITEASHGLSNGDTVVARALTADAIGPLEEEWVYYVINANAGDFQLARSASGAAITFGGAAGTADFYSTQELSEGMVLDLCEEAYANGGLMTSETRTLMCNTQLKRALTYLFVSQKNYQEQTRTVGGVSVSTIQTDFGDLNVMLNRHMPSGALLVVSLEECSPVFLEIPDKGFLFVEPLSKSGASDKYQIYGEVGLEYGNERKHAKLAAVTKPAAA